VALLAGDAAGYAHSSASEVNGGSLATSFIGEHSSASVNI
jgi:hypothetical protein